MDVTFDVTQALRAQDHMHPPLIYDARGNGGGWNRPHHHGRPPKPGDRLYSNRSDL